MKLSKAIFVSCLICAVSSCVARSSKDTYKDDLDFTIAEVEFNYAGFPLLTEEELAEYDRYDMEEEEDE